MKINYLIMLAVALTSTSSFAVPKYNIRTVYGTTTQVYPNDLIQTYKVFLENQGMNTPVLNGDGSISILNPRVLYEGKWMRIYPFSYPNENNTQGLCVHFKLGKFLMARSGTDNKLDLKMVFTDIGSFRHADPSRYFATSITCTRK